MVDCDLSDCQLDNEDSDSDRESDCTRSCTRSRDETTNVQFYVGLSAEAPDSDQGNHDDHRGHDSSTRGPGLSGSCVKVTDTGTTSGLSTVRNSTPLSFQSLLEQYNSLNRQSISTLYSSQANYRQVFDSAESPSCWTSRSSQITFDSLPGYDRKISTLPPPGGVYCIDHHQQVATHGDSYWNLQVLPCARDNSVVDSDINDKIADRSTICLTLPSSLRRPPSLVDDGRADGNQGQSLKPEGPRADIDKLHRVFTREIIMKVLRNVGCWTLIGALLTISVEGNNFSYHFSADANRVVVILILLLGVIGLVSQVVHFCREESCKSDRRTVLANMLINKINRAQFEQLMLDRQQEAPYIGLQLRLRHNMWRHLPATPTYGGHVVRSRRTVRQLDYDTWTDHSAPLYDINWPSTNIGPWCIVVAKDFRLIGPGRLMESEEIDFKEDGHFNSTTMKFEYVLDVQQGDNEFPDTEMFLLMSGTESVTKKIWYSQLLYRVVLSLCVDSLYAGLLYSTTPQLKDYVIVKCFTMRPDFAVYQTDSGDEMNS